MVDKYNLTEDSKRSSKMDPFEVFPIVVWEALLERVEDCADRMTIIRTHPALEALFENKSQEWLLAAAIPVIMKTATGEAISSRRPFVVPLRLVSKLVCRAVDKSIESLWDNCADVPFPLAFSSILHPDFGFRVSVPRFIKMFGDYPPSRSPLVNPHISVVVPFVNPAFPNTTEEERIQVFRKVGPHLKCLDLELQICRSVHSIERSRYLLDQILSLTPKLIYLWLPGDTFRNRNNEAIDVIQELQRADKLNLPDLPCLRILNIGHSMPSVEKDFLGLEKYFPQLTRLAIFWDHWKEEYCSNSTDLFPNLEYLDLRLLLNHPPSYWHPTNIRKFRNQLSNVYKIQAPKIKEFYFQVAHGQTEVLKTVARVETRKGLAYLRERFEGESNWECKAITKRVTIWDLFLRRTTETGVNDGDFLEGDLGEDILEGLQRLSNIKTAVKFASATAILSAGVVLANSQVKAPLAFCIPILLAAGAGLYNLSVN